MKEYNIEKTSVDKEKFSKGEISKIISKARLYDKHCMTYLLINMRSYVNSLEILSEKFVMIDRRRKKICEELFLKKY